MTLRFKPLTFDLGDVSSSPISDYEYQRYVEFGAPTTRLQAVSATGFALKCTAGPHYDAGNPAQSVTFPADFFQTLPKLAVQMLWWRVPRPYLFNWNNTPVHLLEGLGKVDLQPLGALPATVPEFRPLVGRPDLDVWRVGYTPCEVRLQIEYDRWGCDLERSGDQSGGVGLTGMRERADQLGARLVLRSNPLLRHG
jgi:hypothetical protein